MRDGVSQRECAAPATTENVHLAVDMQLLPQAQYVADQMLGRIVGKGCRCVIVPCAGRTLAAAALIEKNDPVSVRVEKASKRLVRARSRPAVHEHDRLSVCRAVFFPVNLMLGILLHSQMASFIAEGVWISACVHFVCHDSRL